ncbi:MAG: helix-turn-helix transcriptional regulator [Candidatus Faecousia sp.]|nr:helix-turn-helix transcriptional regulator [Bacillota bacterium]MDY4599436.1 helix-turn-helix transcriptional regulator [Candidatus Faecousia sp.]
MPKNLSIKVARVQKDMTQKDLAAAVGVSRQTINAIEQGEYNPTIKLCRAICRVLDKTLDELFWEDDKDEKE